MEIDACLQSLFYLTFRVHSMGALPLGSIHRDPTFRDPFNNISKSLVDKPTPGCPTEPH